MDQGYQEKNGRDPNSINFDFITKNLMIEFPKTLLKAIEQIISSIVGNSNYLFLIM